MVVELVKAGVQTFGFGEDGSQCIAGHVLVIGARVVILHFEFKFKCLNICWIRSEIKYEIL